MGQEGGDFRLTHLRRMTFTVKEDEALYPLYIGLFRANTVMLHANDITNLVEQAGLAR
jgi:hypothetical protein